MSLEEEDLPPRREKAGGSSGNERITTRFKIKDGSVLTIPTRALTNSQIGVYSKCPRQYWFRYIAGVSIPPGVARQLGSAGHAAMEENNKHKKRHGADLKAKHVVESFRDTWSKESKAIPTSEWAREGTTRDRAIEKVPEAIRSYMVEEAPKIVPALVEKNVEATFLGVPISGKADVADAHRVLDYKFSGSRSPYLRPEIADQSTQLAIYAALFDRQRAAYIVLDKTRGFAVRVPTKVSPNRIMAAKKNVLHVARGISAGAFPMCPEGSWFCSAKWCGFWNLCRGAKGPQRQP